MQRSGKLSVEVEAHLQMPFGYDPRADGKTYTLNILDHDSSEALLEARADADYVLHELCGHSCWSAQMSL